MSITTDRLQALRMLAKGPTKPGAAGIAEHFCNLATALQDALDEVQAQAELITALTSALRPLANLLDWIEEAGALPDATPVAASRYLTVGDLRRAAVALGQAEMPQQQETEVDV